MAQLTSADRQRQRLRTATKRYREAEHELQHYRAALDTAILFARDELSESEMQRITRLGRRTIRRVLGKE